MTKEKQFQPMLAPSNKDGLDLSKLLYPMLMSPKLDGVRAIVKGGVLLSRNLKPIPSVQAQKLFAGLPEGTDGELGVGRPTALDFYRKTVSVVMSEDKIDAGLRFYVFDNFKIPGGFNKRYSVVSSLQTARHVNVVPHIGVYGPEDVSRLEAEFLEKGYEGGMLRSMNGLYKYGRCTVKEANMLKVKQFLDAEATVTGTYEYMHNDNEAEMNALGRTERSSHKENLRPAGILGGLEVDGLTAYEGQDFRIGCGFDMEQRAELWKERKKLVGKIVKFKYFPTGSKERPRHPVFLGWRDKRDL